MREITVAIDQAELEFEQLAENMDIDIDTSRMDEDDKASFEKQKTRIVRAVMYGDLTFNEDGEAVYTPRHVRTPRKDPITFHERTGASIMAMDTKKKGQDVAKMYAVLGDMCKVPPKTFALMVGTDIKVCEALFAFLMD